MKQILPLRHYVPQFYLRNFLNPKIGRLAVYKKNSSEICLKPIHHICSEPDFFTIFGTEKLKSLKLNNISRKDLNPDCLENQLAKYETEIGRILPQIIDSGSFNTFEDAIFF